MYWPTTTARRLHTSPSGLHQDEVRWHSSDDDVGRSAQIDSEEKCARSGTADAGRIVHTARSHSGQLWAALTFDTFSIWSARPCHVIAALVRTPLSIAEYGANVHLDWRPDGRTVVVQTDKSFLLLYTLHALPPRHAQAYSHIPSNGSGARSRTTREPLAPTLASLRASFAPGPGEGFGQSATELQGTQDNDALGLGEGRHLSLDVRFHLVLRIDAGISTVLATDDYLVVFTAAPSAIQCIPWPEQEPRPEGSGSRKGPRTSLVEWLDWIVKGDVDEQGRTPRVVHASFSDDLSIYVFVTSDGRAYWAQLSFDTRTAIWRGNCFHGAQPKKRRSAELSLEDDEIEIDQAKGNLGTEQAIAHEHQAVTTAVNARFNLLAVGLRNGNVRLYTFRDPGRAAPFSHKLSLSTAMRSTASHLATGACKSLAWTNDGHALAVGWEKGWSVWSAYGKLMGSSLIENWEDASARFSNHFLRGVTSLFWGLGDTELFFCSRSIAAEGEDINADLDGQLFVLPFAKSSVAGQHAPDNTRYAFVQLDDSVLVYRGSDQPDMSIINPESDVWHHIKIPASYMAANWPIRYACISVDGRLIAVAGRRGLTHFSASSGRWKEFLHREQEQSFYVQGGLQWYQHVLIAACHAPATDTYEIRLYSRDAMLEHSSTLFVEDLAAPVVLTSLFDNSLLVYTADNTLHHYLIAILEHDIRLTLCGSITFEGVVGEPERVRGMSWLVPYSQQRFGDPMDDLMVATIIFLIDGKLVLMRPRRGRGDEEEEVSYDMQILGDHIEYYWTHLQGVGTLENSLWGYDGHSIKLWLDALTIEQADIINDSDEDDDKPEYRTIAESVSIPLDFYPLCVLIERGIIIGVEPEVSLRRTLNFAIFRSVTITKLFLQHVLRNYLEKAQLNEAVLFASFYKDLVYFAHALEILLHDVLEDEVDALDSSAPPPSSSNGSIIERDTLTTPSVSGGANAQDIARPASPRRALMPLVVAFLDHFDESLEVVVNCARKTEIARWNYLFAHVGEPRELFETCLAAGDYKTAGSYLLVLHNLASSDVSHENTVRLFRLARDHGWHNLCKDLLRFTRSLDEEGRALRRLVHDAALEGNNGDASSSELPAAEVVGTAAATMTTQSAPASPAVAQRQRPPPTRRTSAGNALEMAIVEEDGETDASPEDVTKVQTAATPLEETAHAVPASQTDHAEAPFMLGVPSNDRNGTTTPPLQSASALFDGADGDDFFANASRSKSMQA